MKHLPLIAALLLPPAAAAMAQEEPQDASGIVAVVNDEVISSLDMGNRLALVLSTTRLSDTPEVRARLRPQLLRALLDEKLQLQEAARNGIEVNEADIARAVEGIEQQRNIPPGGLLSRLDAIGVPREAFLSQVRAQLAWTKLVLRTLRSQVKISDDEVERERGKLTQKGGGAEVQIEMLTLPVDRPENEAQVKALAEKLAAEMRAGAPFESVARELGGAGGAAIQPMWAPLAQLDASLGAALAGADPGAITEPVRTADGYTLAKLLDKRQTTPRSALTEAVVKDILLKLKFDASQQDAEVMLSIGKEVAKNPGTCSDEGIAGLKNLDDFDIEVQFRREGLEALSPELQAIIGRLPVGGVSEPYATEEGIRMFMLCERVEKPGDLADTEETYQRLFQQKLELEAQKYLRALRRDATVDVRL